MIYNDLRCSKQQLEYLTLEESYSLSDLYSIPIINSSLGYLVSYSDISKLSEDYGVDDTVVVESLCNTNNIEYLSVLIEEYETIDADYSPKLRYVISPLREDDYEYLYTDACIYLAEQYDDDRYLYLLEDLQAFDEGLGSWIKNQVQTGKNIWHNIVSGETPQQREIRTGEGMNHELSKKRDSTSIEDKVQELKNNENGNHNWHSFNPKDEESKKSRFGLKNYFNKKKSDYTDIRATGAGKVKAGKTILKDVGQDTLKYAKEHKKGTAGVAAGTIAALSLAHPNIRKRITALRNRILGLEKKNKQGRFSKIITKLKSILNRLTSKLGGGKK